MKTIHIFSSPYNLNHPEVKKPVNSVHIFRTTLLVIMLFGLTLLSSCLVPGPGRGRYMNESRHNERNEQNQHHGDNEHEGENNGNGHRK